MQSFSIFLSQVHAISVQEGPYLETNSHLPGKYISISFHALSGPYFPRFLIECSRPHGLRKQDIL
jgi:hypothetical protein